MNVDIHRRLQWDLAGHWNLSVKPFICIHVQRGNYTSRVFVLWKNGIRAFGIDIRWCTYGVPRGPLGD